MECPTYFDIENKGPAMARLAACCAQVATLLNDESQAKIHACLDELLGAAYSLILAIRCDYKDRQHPLRPEHIEDVVKRARSMSEGRVRTDGGWTAGYYFNSAMYRLSSVYDRALRLLDKGTEADKLGQISAWSQSEKGAGWDSTATGVIRREVIDLKHKPEAKSQGRSATLHDALRASEDLMALFQIYSKYLPKA